MYYCRTKPDCLLLLGDLTSVELELSALEDVAIRAAALAGAGGDAGEETARGELLLEVLAELDGGTSLGSLLSSTLGGVGDGGDLAVDLLAEGDAVLLLEVSAEGGSIDL